LGSEHCAASQNGAGALPEGFNGKTAADAEASSITQRIDRIIFNCLRELSSPQYKLLPFYICWTYIQIHFRDKLL
jgi:hypothetical protein